MLVCQSFAPGVVTIASRTFEDNYLHTIFATEVGSHEETIDLCTYGRILGRESMIRLIPRMKVRERGRYSINGRSPGS